MVKLKVRNLRNYRYEWNEHVNLPKFDINYNIDNFNNIFIPISNQYFFKISNTSLDFYRNDTKLLSIYVADNMKWQKPLVFRGSFRFYTYSNHLFWKWKGLKIRLLLYYDYKGEGAILRFLYKNLNRSDIKIEMYSDSLEVAISKKKKNSYKIFNKALMFDREVKENRVIFSDIKDDLDFSKEEYKWVSHCKQVKRIYKRKLIFIDDKDIMRKFLLDLYRESDYGRNFKKFTSFNFLNFDYKNSLQIFNNVEFNNKFFFRFFFDNYFLIEGCYSNNKLINCLLINKGVSTLNIYFNYKRFFNKKFFFVFNNRLQKLMNVNFITNGFVVTFEKSDKIFINFFKNILKKFFS